MNRHRLSRALLWPAGFTVATLLAVGLFRPFTSSIIPWTRDASLGTVVPETGYVHRYRREGHGETRFGRFGVPAVDDLRALSSPAVAIWGDSFVEAYQVDDPLKTAQRVTARSGGHVTGVGIGRGGRQLGDYVRLMPRYESLFAPSLHVVVVADLLDVYPEHDADGFRLDAHPTRIEAPRLRRVLARLGLDFVFTALQTPTGGGLRFRPGPVAHAEATDDRLPPLTPEAAEFAVATLCAATDRPVLVLYAPRLPAIEAGRLRTSLDTAETAAVETLAAACAGAGIAFVDLGDRLVQAWRNTGRFPRGFANGMPSRGHWNALGHDVAAQAILEHLATLGPEE